jgi:oxygen-independent coproporphyrinogen-3 oxidase
LPDQSLADWQESLSWAVDQGVEHLSFYGLTVEPGTRFHHLQAEGRLPLPGEALQAGMYRLGRGFLLGQGFEHYEISNFARPGHACRHNQLYWRNRDTLGIGAGAWSFLAGERSMRERDPRRYVEAVLAGSDPVVERERLEGRRARGEAALLGLRMLQGIDLAAWQAEQGRAWDEDFKEQTSRLERKGLLRADQGRVRLSEAGLLLANEAFVEFVEGGHP